MNPGDKVLDTSVGYVTSGQELEFDHYDYRSVTLAWCVDSGGNTWVLVEAAYLTPAVSHAQKARTERAEAAVEAIANALSRDGRNGVAAAVRSLGGSLRTDLTTIIADALKPGWGEGL